MTDEEMDRLLKRIDERNEAQSTRLENSMLKAFAEHKDKDHSPVEERVRSLEGKSKFMSGVTWAIGGVFGAIETMCDFFHFGGNHIPPAHP